MDDDKIRPIGVRFAKPSDEKMFTVIQNDYSGCLEHSYLIDQKAGTITCQKCKKAFDPMWALIDLARKESRWMDQYKRHEEEMKRLDERSKTTCQHCKKLTKISRN